jgi:hypothetical protein
MGTPAYAEVLIVIDDSIEAIGKIRDWVDKANKGDLGGDFDIHLGGEFNANFVDAQLSSERVQNLEWQDEQFCEFCKTIPEVTEYSSNVWIRGEGQWYERE